MYYGQNIYIVNVHSKLTRGKDFELAGIYKTKYV